MTKRGPTTLSKLRGRIRELESEHEAYVAESRSRIAGLDRRLIKLESGPPTVIVSPPETDEERELSAWTRRLKARWPKSQSQ